MQNAAQQERCAVDLFFGSLIDRMLRVTTRPEIAYKIHHLLWTAPSQKFLRHRRDFERDNNTFVPFENLRLTVAERVIDQIQDILILLRNEDPEMNLAARKIFAWASLNFLPVGHTHAVPACL